MIDISSNEQDKLIMRIYIDTSVVGGFYDAEFEEPTKEFFSKVEKGEIVLVVSELLEAELLRAPERVRDHLDRYSREQIVIVELTEEANNLADHYIAERVVGATSKADCRRNSTEPMFLSFLGQVAKSSD